MWTTNHSMHETLPRAIVLADPAAWIHRSSINNQYADVGTRASPTHDRDKTIMQARIMGLRPQRSERVPQNMGAVNETKYERER